ncbi:hypothetical protein GOODEAATRI_027581 [Goodea atripinnis]|uniref:Uncharacterized protein n=1 Tax=Goodea atripinnis TaxID=208336 RepID=A0ABV0ML70_9TELE
MLKHADLLVAEVRKRSMHVVLEPSTTLRVCRNCPDLHSGRYVLHPSLPVTHTHYIMNDITGKGDPGHG